LTREEHQGASEDVDERGASEDVDERVASEDVDVDERVK
jgi:hypothetical protein